MRLNMKRNELNKTSELKKTNTKKIKKVVSKTKKNFKKKVKSAFVGMSRERDGVSYIL